MISPQTVFLASDSDLWSRWNHTRSRSKKMILYESKRFVSVFYVGCLTGNSGCILNILTRTRRSVRQINAIDVVWKTRSSREKDICVAFFVLIQQLISCSQLLYHIYVEDKVLKHCRRYQTSLICIAKISYNDTRTAIYSFFKHLNHQKIDALLPRKMWLMCVKAVIAN